MEHDANDIVKFEPNGSYIQSDDKTYPITGWKATLVIATGVVVITLLIVLGLFRLFGI